MKYWTTLQKLMWLKRVSGGSQEYEGDIVEFVTNSSKQLKNLIISMSPIQEGTGDPSPDNVRPIYGRTGASAYRNGINQWDEEWEVGAYNGTTGEKTPNNTNLRCKNAVPVLPSTAYYFKSPNAMYVFEYDGSDNFLGYTAVLNNTLTTKVNTASVRFYLLAAYGTTYNNDISINYPSTDTDYHAYQGNLFSVDWTDEAGTVYSGTVDIVTGEMTVDMAMVDMGDYTWTYDSRYTRFQHTFADIKPSTARTLSMLCSELVCISDGRQISAVPDCAVYAGERVVNVKYLSFGSDTAAFKTAMSGVQLCYPLETPITYQLTPQQVMSLVGSNVVWSPDGSVKVRV